MAKAIGQHDPSDSTITQRALEAAQTIASPRDRSTALIQVAKAILEHDASKSTIIDQAAKAARVIASSSVEAPQHCVD